HCSLATLETVLRRVIESLESTGRSRNTPTGLGPRTTLSETGPCGVNSTVRSYVAPGKSGVACAPAGAAHAAGTSATAAVARAMRRTAAEGIRTEMAALQ